MKNLVMVYNTSTNKIEKGTVKEVVIVYGEGYLHKSDILISSRKCSLGFYICQTLNAAAMYPIGVGLLGVHFDFQMLKGNSFSKVIQFTRCAIDTKHV